MIFREHSDLADRHAFLSPSKYHWIRYDLDKLEEVYIASRAAALGTRKHILAHDLISLKEKLPRAKKTLNMYVNDCIGWRMQTEVILYFSEHIFGTADAISFQKGVLRISDLKTGKGPTKFDQLEVYAALFCLEYEVKPFQIPIELRIYQNDEVRFEKGDPDSITHIMDKAISFNRHIEKLRREGL